MVGGLLSAHLLARRAGLILEPGWPCEGPLLGYPYFYNSSLPVFLPKLIIVVFLIQGRRISRAQTASWYVPIYCLFVLLNHTCFLAVWRSVRDADRNAVRGNQSAERRAAQRDFGDGDGERRHVHRGVRGAQPTHRRHAFRARRAASTQGALGFALATESRSLLSSTSVFFLFDFLHQITAYKLCI